MSSICLSIASNIRCSNLTHPQQITLLVLPIIDLVFCVALLKVNWGNVKIHQWSLVVETITYFVLALFDFLEKDWARHGLDVAAFQTYDRAIGVLTIFPVFFYTIGLGLLAREDVLPLASSKSIRRLTLFSFCLIIPTIIILNEVAGLISVIYRVSGKQVLQGYASADAQMTSRIFSSMTLTLLSAFQLVIALNCLFYIFRARASGHGGGVIPGFACIAIGLLAGTVETLLGFGYFPTTNFSMIIARKLIKTIARAVILTALILGTSAEEGFALYPNPASQNQMMEKGNTRNMRALISNPRSSTFVRVPADPSVYATLNRLRDSSNGAGFVRDPWAPVEYLAPERSRDDRQPVENVPVPARLPAGFTAGLPPTALRRFSSGQTSPRSGQSRRPLSDSGPKSQKVKKGFTPFAPDEIARFPSRANRPGDRVTIQFRGGDYSQAPVLKMRLSDLEIPSPGAVMESLRTADELSMMGHNHGRPYGSYDPELLQASSSLLGSTQLPSSGRRFQYPTERERNVSSGSEISEAVKRMMDMANRLPSLPIKPVAARLSHRFSLMSGAALNPGRWAPLSNEPSSAGPSSGDMEHQPVISPPSTSSTAAPPRPPFVKQDRSSNSSSYSDTESLWLRAGIIPPIRPTRSYSADRDSLVIPRVQHLSTPSNRARHDSGSRYDGTASGNSTPTSARIVEARTMSLRPERYEYRSNPIGEATMPRRIGPPAALSPSSINTSNMSTVVDTFSPTGLSAVDSPIRSKGKLFELELGGRGGAGSGTRQIYASERRVSRIPTDLPRSRLGSDPAPVRLREAPARPRIATRAIDLETGRRSEGTDDGEAGGGTSNAELSKRWEKSPQSTMPPRFRNISSVDFTTENSAESAGVASTGQVKAIGRVMVRTPTITESEDDRESIAPDHVSQSLTDLREGFGFQQRYDFVRSSEDRMSQLSAMESAEGRRSITTPTIHRKDSGVLAPEDQSLISRASSSTPTSGVFHAI